MPECLMVVVEGDCIVAVQDTGSSTSGPLAAGSATEPGPTPKPASGPAAAGSVPKPGPAP